MQFNINIIILQRLPEQLSCDGLQDDLKRLRRQLDVVSSQVLQLILAQQPPCQDEFKRLVSLLFTSSEK